MNNSFFVSTPRTNSQTFRLPAISSNFYKTTLKHMVCLDTLAFDALRSQLQYFQLYETRDDLNASLLDEIEKIAEVSWNQFDGVKNNLLTDDLFIDPGKFAPFARGPVSDIVKRCNLATFSHFMFDPHNPIVINLQMAEAAFYYYIIPTEICQNDASLFWRLSLDLKTQLYIQAVNPNSREVSLDKLFPRVVEQPPDFIDEYVQRREQLESTDPMRLPEKFPWNKFIKEMFNLIISISESIPVPMVSESTKSILTTTPDRTIFDQQQGTVNSDRNLTPPIDRVNVGRSSVNTPTRNSKFFGAWNKYENASERDLTTAMDSLGLRPMMIDQENNSGNRADNASDPIIASTSAAAISPSSTVNGGGSSEDITISDITVKNVTPIRASMPSAEKFMTPTVVIDDPPPHEDLTDDESENMPIRNKSAIRMSKKSKKSEWSQREMDALIAGMKEFHTSWSQIKSKYKKTLTKRDQMHLKDKARTECERRIKMKIPLDIFEIVKPHHNFSESIQDH